MAQGYQRNKDVDAIKKFEKFSKQRKCASRFDFGDFKIFAGSVGKCGFCAFGSGLAETCPGASVSPLCEKLRYKVQRKAVIRADHDKNRYDKFRFEFRNKSLTYESGISKPHFTARNGKTLGCLKFFMCCQVLRVSRFQKK